MPKFPRVRAAMAEKGRAQYEVARRVGMSESRFSRCLRGVDEFCAEEREKIAKFLGYPKDWLFQEIKPPRRQRRNVPEPAQAPKAE